ncbi:hypothetical protein PVK06_008322 [Gossypium arboreum]|uniref:Uncharacterized protein n=1 Tax=Gossypium arboreum TaxID=29729 RepID=A0ABR0QKI3_GOSAR|nr:hypothetical protein PVK06_008322 [Gossypium arboreum]
MDQRQLYGDLLRMRVVDKLDNYLGLPVPVGKKKSMAFQSILSRFSCRINNWSKRLLFYGGKEIFINSKYFPSGNIFHSKVVNKLSYTQTSIATTAKALENGFDWQVGTGNNIDICNNNWGFEGLNGDSLCSTTLTIHEINVHDLWVNNHSS